MVENFRIGQGHDLHRLSTDGSLILGGIKIDSTFGTIAHSDGDALIHSIIDALLGALSLGDIGNLFPDNDDQFHNISSEILLNKTINLIYSKGYQLNNLDSTIKLQTPKLQSYIPKIRTNLAKLFSTNIDNVSIKAKTGEGIGIIGESKAIACDTVLLLKARK